MSNKFINIRHSGELDEYLEKIKSNHDISTNSKAVTHAVKNIVYRESLVYDLRGKVVRLSKQVDILMKNKNDFLTALENLKKSEN